MTPAELTLLEAQLLLEGIYARYGYDFRGYARESMVRRLLLAQSRIGAESLGELQHALLTDPELFVSVLEQLTVRVSDVFRDPEFYADFRAHVVPSLRTYPTLKIWLAGCASGEEVYSTAILLEEEGLLERATLYATDISAGALREAKQGVYDGARLATFAANYRHFGGRARFEDYCRAGPEQLVMREELRHNVVFFQHDLVNDYSLGEMNVAFCRNVLIYFGPELRLRTLHLLGGCLCTGGYLCLGTSEALPEPVRGSFQVLSARSRIFQLAGPS